MFNPLYFSDFYILTFAKRFPGRDLKGKTYKPLFPYFEKVNYNFKSAMLDDMKLKLQK